MNRMSWIGAVRAVAMVVALPAVVQVLGQGVATAATIPPSSVGESSVTTVPDSSASKVVVASGKTPRDPIEVRCDSQSNVRRDCWYKAITRIRC